MQQVLDDVGLDEDENRILHFIKMPTNVPKVNEPVYIISPRWHAPKTCDAAKFKLQNILGGVNQVESCEEIGT